MKENENHWRNHQERLRQHIFKLFDDFLEKYPFEDYRKHNALLHVRNLIDESVQIFLNEPSIKKKYGVSVDSLSLISFGNARFSPEKSTSEEWETVDLRNSWIPIPSEEDEIRPAGITNEEFAKYSERLHKLFVEADQYVSPLCDHVLSLFREAFLKPSKNRPFKSGTYVRNDAGVPTASNESIKKQNIPCQICGENRVTEACHIIPTRIGGTWKIDNILFLCPTHHSLFDRGRLSRDEWNKLDWSMKSKKSQKYVSKVLKVVQEKFWKKVESGIFEKEHEGVFPGDIYVLYEKRKSEIEEENN
ncbi:MAG: HNH endonuclease [Phycisphaerae bacterium]|nr:HNH endonuclease [Phycisphaerae bacterium]